MDLKYLVVGGSESRASGYISKLFIEMIKLNREGELKNGYSYDDLCDIVDNKLSGYDCIFWFPDIDNSKEKIVLKIKEKRKDLILVTSKRNNDEYSYHNLVARGLKNKSNLIVSLKKENSIVHSTILDPLGNLWGTENEVSVENVAYTLIKRVTELSCYTRVESVCEFAIPSPVEIDEQFLNVCKKHSDRYHELIHSENKDRFLGNISFRCESGFPSFKSNGRIYVSKRNVDKREIDKSNFVEVEYDRKVVKYWGLNKPSVDAAIHCLLYDYFENVKYALHSHVYIKHPDVTTSKKIPCGALEEAFEIIGMVSDKGTKKLRINLFGHGSMVLSDDVSFIEKTEYYALPMLEVE